MGSNQFASQFDCGDHGGWVGDALAGDGEGGSVVGAGAGFGEAEGDVDCLIEI